MSTALTTLRGALAAIGLIVVVLAVPGMAGADDFRLTFNPPSHEMRDDPRACGHREAP